MKHPVLAITLAFAMSFPPSAQAIELGKSQSLSASEQVPEGLTAADWSSIRAAAGVTRQEAYLKADNTGAGDEFGRSVAVAGDTVVVGAPGEDGSNNSVSNSGAVYVFVRTGGTWSQQAYLKASNTSAGDEFGCSVAVAGDTVVIGAYAKAGVVNSSSNELETFSGAAYVFVRSGSTWSEQAYLMASNAAASDLFGYSVAVAGDTVVVGAHREDSNAVGVNNDQVNNSATNSGAAYVFVRSGSNWSQQAYFKASNTGAGDQFGYSVAVAGETVVVGAHTEDSATSGVNSSPSETASDSGAAYVFVRSGSTWSQQAYLKASNPGAGDYFGIAVAVAGDTVVVGAQYEDSSTRGSNSSPDDAASDSGAAYVFARNGSTWSEQAYLKASNTGTADQFGISLAIVGDTLVVGAYGERSSTTGVNSTSNEAARSSGAAYVFTRSGSTWSQESYLKASNPSANDYFGYSVAISGSTLISGAYNEDSSTIGINSVPNDIGTADNSGAAYLFTLPVAELPPVIPPPVIPPVVVPPTVVKFLITAKVSKAKFGKVIGAGSFDTGSSVKLKAKAKKGRKFVGWYEKKKLLSKKKVFVIKKLTKNRSLVAKFR